MEIIVKDDKGDVLSKRDVELKELNLTERGECLDLMRDFYLDPQKDLFTRAIKFCRLCTDYTDEELNEWSEAEFLQLMGIILQEKNKKKL
jgi:hypothetical protein